MLTVVIPTKNEEELLPRLLDSIAKQTLQPTEVIVADAQSSDETRTIATEAGATVIEGGRISFARNQGAARATTPFILFLDADVELSHPEFLKEALTIFRERNLDVGTFDLEPISQKRIDHFLHRAYNLYARAWGARYPHAPGSCILVRRAVHEAMQGFDEEINFCEDHQYVRTAATMGYQFGIIKELKVPVSTRRLERDGRWNILIKFTLAELYLTFVGPIKDDRFNYTFGHEKPKKH